MLNRLDAEEWAERPPSRKQLGFMRWKGISTAGVKSGYEASQLIDAKMNPSDYADKKTREMTEAKNEHELTALAHDVRLVQSVLDRDVYVRLVAVGKQKREMFRNPQEAF